MDFITLGSLGVVAALGAGFYTSYNRLMALDERCNTAFADIDVQLKHRHSVIPMLVETVSGFAKHESGILTAVTEARANAMHAVTPETRLEAEAQLGVAISSLVSQAEQYPELKASSHFRELRVELTDIENRITASRRYFNTTVDEFNATVRQFPGKLVGNFARLGTRKHFDVGAERMFLDEPVAIKF